MINGDIKYFGTTEAEMKDGALNKVITRLAKAKNVTFENVCVDASEAEPSLHCSITINGGKWYVSVFEIDVNIFEVQTFSECGRLGVDGYICNDARDIVRDIARCIGDAIFQELILGEY